MFFFIWSPSLTFQKKGEMFFFLEIFFIALPHYILDFVYSKTAKYNRVTLVPMLS